jgi:hypothetical protein
MFCKHDWELVSERTTKSKFECAVDSLRKVSSGSVSIPHQMSCADRKHIQIVACIKCGKLKRYVEDI